MTPEAFFESRFQYAPTITATAPGRLEFIGNHTDYNGGLVMGVAVDRGITVSAAKRADARIVLASKEMETEAFANIHDLRPLSETSSWANYALGMFDQMQKAGLEAEVGFDMIVSSTLPYGAGMSSSAAFELASGLALGALYGFKQSTADWARLARRAENQFVGVPCGILDQGVSAFGQKNHLVRIDCLTETFDRVPMTPGLHFWVFNTGVKHALLDSLYATRHAECMEALKILQKAQPDLACLAAASPALVAAEHQQLGETLTRRARHITEETERVRAMEAALKAGDLTAAGKLLTASHASSRDLFENSCRELDCLVEQLSALPSVYGCRLTGGGFGGAVMAVTDAEFGQPEADAVTVAYSAHFDHSPSIFHTRSGDGARLL